jgi:hypothetical protein
MKSAKREWALIAAFTLFMVFSLSHHAFMMGNSVGIGKMKQVHELSTLGSLLGALLLPLLLPFGDLRERRRPSRYALRLALAAAFFIPNIIIRLLGQRAWMENSFNSGFMAFANGMIVTLMAGCIFSLTGKNRVLWPALAVSVSIFVYHYILGPGRELLPFMFAFAGFTMTAAGVLLLVYLAGAEPDGEIKIVPQSRSLSGSGEEYPSNRLVSTYLGGGKMAFSRACRSGSFLD